MSFKAPVVVLSTLTLVSALFCGTAAAQASRDYIYVVGSSTVYPFSTVVAERFGRSTDRGTQHRNLGARHISAQLAVYGSKRHDNWL